MSSETDVAPEGIGPHDDEPHQEGIGGRLNALRAAVLGANDGIVSVAGIVMGVAGATSHADAIFVAGVAGLVAGALSMAAGEYVSVSTQRDRNRVSHAKRPPGSVADASMSPRRSLTTKVLPSRICTSPSVMTAPVR